MNEEIKCYAEGSMRERVSLMDRFALPGSSLWRVGLGYTLLWWALLVWACLAPSSFWFGGNLVASGASQVMIVFSILTPFFIAFVIYFPLSRAKGKGKVNSSASTESPPKTTREYLQHCFNCFLLTLIPLFFMYVLFALLSWFGFLSKDLVSSIILGGFFPLLVLSLTLLTSTLSVGLAMVGSRLLDAFAVAVAIAVVVLPFVLSEMVTGTSFPMHTVKVAQMFDQSPALSILLTLSALLVGGIFLWLYRRKQS